MLISKFTEIIAWQKAHELVLKIYKLSKKFPSEEKFGLTSQIRRAALSVPANIAEGFKRNGVKDSLNFYNFSQGSLEEVKYYLLVAKDLEYISSEEYKEHFNFADEVGKILHGWIKKQK